MTVLVTLLVSVLRWWGKLGLHGPQTWRNLHLLALPAALVLIVPFLHGFRALPLSTTLYLAAGYALTGFYEELWARGVLLRVLRPSGQARAVVASAVLFGAMHLGNLLYRDPAIVAAQIVGAFCFGLAFAALRFRTNALWTLMVLHALHDFTLRYSNFPLIPLNVIQDIVLLGFAWVLLRGMRRSGTEDAGSAVAHPANI
jgi:membrane protease YdiL (CAAX protease family)